ncbi:MAG: NAD(P)H-dependent oxidoreductase [Rhizobiaceae bacterium]|nr:NAD(P)H-dependent oxidoreductase [Rhizobiaceae bacterium]
MNTDIPNRTLILNGNPSRSSLGAALAETMAEAARAKGDDVRVLHLQDLVFAPDLTAGYRARQELEPDLVAFQQDLMWCQTFVLVHPLWWGGAPAKLKGLFDRVLLPEFAFRYVEGRPLPEKLLSGRTARVLITTDTPGWFLRLAYRNAWPNQLRRQILDFVGLKVTRIATIGPIRGAKPGANDAWFAAARKLMQ